MEAGDSSTSTDPAVHAITGDSDADNVTADLSRREDASSSPSSVGWTSVNASNTTSLAGNASSDVASDLHPSAGESRNATLASVEATHAPLNGTPETAVASAERTEEVGHGAGEAITLLESAGAQKSDIAPKALNLRSVRGVHLLIVASSLACLLFMALCVSEGRKKFRKGRRAMTLPPVQSDPVADVMTYETAGMATWDVFSAYTVTIFGKSKSLWRSVWRLLLLAAAVAVCEALIVSNISAWSPVRFSDVALVLHIFGALLLAVFLATSVGRWYSRVGGFLDLMNVIRSMQLELHALGVEQDRCDLACRYGVLSVWGLVYEMRRKAVHSQGTAEESDALSRMLAEFESRPSTLSQLLPNERRLLEGVDNFPGLMWVWVGSLLGRMAQDGEIPHMGSAAYSRLVELVQEAQGGMRLVRDSATIQLHLAYMHAVSAVVHLNNIFSAVSLGLALGACAGNVLSPPAPLLPGLRADAEVEAMAAVVMLLRCLLLPLAFLASLEVGLSLNQPFTSEHGTIPVERFLCRLEGDLQDCSRIVAAPPSWQKPKFQEVPESDEELARKGLSSREFCERFLAEPLAESAAGAGHS